MVYPIFPFVQKTLTKIGLLHHQGRQPYHIGWLAPSTTLSDLKSHLKNTWGFGNHFVAWIDTDQVLSWRKLETFKTQYHLRIFKDGEIRGHFEYTPEAYPIKHFLGHGEENREAEFRKFLDTFVVQREHTTDLSHELATTSSEPQLTFVHTLKVTTN